jgi:hypothetical protein
MGFGLRNAGNTFQRMMDRVINGLPFIFLYLDDIIVGSPDLASHLQHLQLLFQRLRDFGLVINGEKGEFGAKELDFLGHRVSADGVAPLKKKVDALLEHPLPRRRRRRRQPTATRTPPPSWPGRPLDSAGSTGSLETKLTAAGLPAPGRETRVPGPPQRRRPRVLGSHRGPIVRKAFFN